MRLGELDDRYGSNSDIATELPDVRFTPGTDIERPLRHVRSVPRTDMQARISRCSISSIQARVVVNSGRRLCSAPLDQ